MSKVIIAVGLPGAGKTTWAEQFIDEHPDTIRVNKDILRSMLHGNKEYAPESEGLVCVVRDCIIEHALLARYDIVCDDTNLNPKHICQINAVARRYAHDDMIIFKDFTNVPLEVCKERNRNRRDKEPIPEEAIVRMYNDHFENGLWKYATSDAWLRAKMQNAQDECD